MSQSKAGGLAVRDARRPAVRPGGRSGSGRLPGEGPWRLLTVSPALLIFALFTILPIGTLLLMAVHQVTWVEGSSVWTFVGLDNFRALAGDNLFRAGIVNTLIFAFVAVGAQMVIGFFLALLVSDVNLGKTVYRTIFLLPILVPGIVIGAIWKLMYNFDFGIINQTLGAIGIGPQNWLGEPALALASIIVVDIWHWTPFCFLLLLAGLQSLPQDIFEAARVDGATAWQRLRYVTLPLMIPTIAVTFVFRTILAFKVFDEIFLLTGGGPGTATEVLSFTIYRRFFTEDRVGYGSAMSLATFLGVALIIIIAMNLSRRRGAAAV